MAGTVTKFVRGQDWHPHLHAACDGWEAAQHALANVTTPDALVRSATLAKNSRANFDRELLALARGERRRKGDPYYA